MTTTLAQLYATQGEGIFENNQATAVVVFGSTASNAPVPSFTATTASTTGYAPMTVQFTDTSTGTPTAWLWDFGDGSTATTQNPSHVYQNVGVYNVTLTATNANGQASVVQHGLVIVTTAKMAVAAQTVLGAAKSAASFTASATTGAHPLTVTFTDTSTNSPTKWSWDFGDSGKASVQNPVHIFDHAGTFNVTLSVENAGGYSISTPMVVTVS